MTPEQLAMLAVAVEASTRPQFKALLAGFTDSPQEQTVIMGGVIGLMARQMYKQLGDAWLEAFIRAVMQPDPSSPGPPSSPAT